MGVINMVKNIKEIHPKTILCLKIGSFYHCYGKDSYILSFIFDYKIKTAGKEEISTCGFPKDSLSKVKAKLELNKIDYLIIDTKNQYNIDEKMSFDNLNRYDEFYSKSNKYIRIRRRLNEIIKDLLVEFEKEETIAKIRKIEEIVYENGKV